MALIQQCDVCKSIKDVTQKDFWIDRKMDAAGSMSDECVHKDVCKNCLLKLYETTIFEMAKEQLPNCPQSYSGPIMAKIVQKMIKNARYQSKNS